MIFPCKRESLKSGIVVEFTNRTTGRVVNTPKYNGTFYRIGHFSYSWWDARDNKHWKDYNPIKDYDPSQNGDIDSDI